MSNHKMGAGQRRVNTRRLLEKHGGQCTRCGIRVAAVYEMRPQGWTFLDTAESFLVSTEGEILAVATIEHVVPVCDGGTNQFDNLTLLCKQCNHTDHWKRKGDRAKS